MKINFKIAKFKLNNDVFIKEGYNEYAITFLKGTKIHQLRIVVNGYLTNQKINLLNYSEGYKNKILLAIKEYIFDKKNTNIVSKKITMEYIKQMYSNMVINNVKKHLINISKEESRDKLTEFGLINI